MNLRPELGILETWVTRVGETLDAPVFQEGTFIYRQMTAPHVAFLKAVRGVQSLHSLCALASKGLFIDCGTITRCLFDCNSEIYFLLESYPSVSEDVSKFVQHFVSTSLVGETDGVPPVASKKVHAARARLLEQRVEFGESFGGMRRSYEALCLYVHADYPAVMEIYGGRCGEYKFHMSGVPSQRARRYNRKLWME